jgi:hypothetical protein
MKSASIRYLELLESRLELLQKLVRSEEEWRTAFVRLNLHDSERCSADQELICDRISYLDKQISTLPARSSESGEAEVDPAIDPRIRAALGRMAALRLGLKRTNETNTAILQRSKVTINALRNLFNSLAPTYAAPAAHSVGTIYEENV